MGGRISSFPAPGSRGKHILHAAGNLDMRAYIFVVHFKIVRFLAGEPSGWPLEKELSALAFFLCTLLRVAGVGQRV
jgi:hypothetical protein